MAALVRLRETVVEEWAKEHPGRDVFEDRRLEITSELSISVDDQIKEIETALRAHR